MRTGLLLLVILCCYNIGTAQKGKIILMKDIAQYEDSGDLMNYTELKHVLSQNSDANEYLKRHNSARTGSMVLGAIGGGLIGWPIGTALGGGDPEWAMLGIGAGVVGLGLLVESNSKKNLQRSVDIYNISRDQSLEKKNRIAPSIILGLHGMMFQLKF